MNVADKAFETATTRGLFGPESACLLMVSGGSDSTALAYVMAHLRHIHKLGALAMLHVNHKLRGDDADKDAAFCASLAQVLAIPYFACEVDVASEAALAGRNLEAQGRLERYAAAAEALSSFCQHEGFDLSDGRIVVAHTADDRAENFYMRSIIGAGPGAFRGMHYQHNNVVRPLLDCSRDELRAFIAKTADDGLPVARDEHGALWREDASNECTDYFRAFVRKNMVPAAREWNMQAVSNLVRSMNLIADEDDMLNQMASDAIASHVEVLPDSSIRLLPSFASVKTPLQRRALILLLQGMLEPDTRIESQTVGRILDAFSDGKPRSGYVDNLQGNFALSANKNGVLIEPMETFRTRRNKA